MPEGDVGFTVDLDEKGSAGCREIRGRMREMTMHEISKKES